MLSTFQTKEEQPLAETTNSLFHPRRRCCRAIYLNPNGILGKKGELVTMQNEEPERIITFLNDDWEDAMKGLSDDDMIAYGQKIYG